MGVHLSSKEKQSEGWVMESHAICPSLQANFCRYWDLSLMLCVWRASQWGMSKVIPILSLSPCQKGPMVGRKWWILTGDDSFPYGQIPTPGFHDMSFADFSRSHWIADSDPGLCWTVPKAVPNLLNTYGVYVSRTMYAFLTSFNRHADSTEENDCNYW